MEIGEETSDELRTLEQAVLDAESELDAFAADITLRRALGDRYHSHLETRIQALEVAKSDYKDFAREVQVRERISAADLLSSEDPLILPELYAASSRRSRSSPDGETWPGASGSFQWATTRLPG